MHARVVRSVLSVDSPGHVERKQPLTVADPHTHFGQPAYIAPISSRETPLVNNLIRFFSEDEIYAIAADTFGLPVDEFAAANRSGIVRELVGYAARQKKLEELDGAMVERRPFLVRVMG